ncbi:isopentenyl phosphate kinase [Patescibacteria group bacterium]
MKKELTLIKLGGSLITDKNKAFTAKKGVIQRLAGEIKSSLSLHKTDLIVGHGSGSFGHVVASKYKTQEGIVNKDSIKGFPLVADAARKINTIVMEEFLKKGLKVVSFSPLSYTYAKNQKRIKSSIKPIKKALEIGIIPVIYGDVIMDEKMGFCIYSGEKSLNVLAEELKDAYKKIKIIYCGETDGVYDEKGKTISIITSKNFKKIKKALGGSSGVDVTGGMIHKVKEALEIAKKINALTLIINATKKQALKKALEGNQLGATKIVY